MSGKGGRGGVPATSRIGGRADQMTVGVWLIGLGILLATGEWWPGVLFVLGASAIVRGLAEGRSWQSLRGASWIIGIGLWFALGIDPAVLLVVLGIGVLLTAFNRPSFAGKTPVDRDPLE
jgi:hypothetical protein